VGEPESADSCCDESDRVLDGRTRRILDHAVKATDVGKGQGLKTRKLGIPRNHEDRDFTIEANHAESFAVDG
jgi:hypothetical protein